MSEDRKYNGWTNYETWLVKLWMDNDQGSQEYWQERAQETWNDATPGTYDWQTREAEAASSLADELKDQHEEQAHEQVGSNGWLADLVGAALGSVNWHEIAESLLEDVDKDDDEQEAA